MKQKIGNIVYSIKGRDCNSISIVYKVLDNGYVLLVDGKNKRISNPKLKNSKHLKVLGHNDILASKLQSGLNILDAEIRLCIKDFQNLKQEAINV